LDTGEAMLPFLRPDGLLGLVCERELDARSRETHSILLLNGLLKAARTNLIPLLARGGAARACIQPALLVSNRSYLSIERGSSTHDLPRNLPFRLAGPVPGQLSPADHGPNLRPTVIAAFPLRRCTPDQTCRLCPVRHRLVRLSPSFASPISVPPHVFQARRARGTSRVTHSHRFDIPQWGVRTLGTVPLPVPC
jgi:hypothetical protein